MNRGGGGLSFEGCKTVATQNSPPIEAALSSVSLRCVHFSEANMSDVDPRSGINILVKQICGVKNEKKREQSYIAKGELLVEIPPKDRVAQQQDVPPYNYCLLRNPNVTLYDTGVNVSPLFGVRPG